MRGFQLKIAFHLIRIFVHLQNYSQRITIENKNARQKNKESHIQSQRKQEVEREKKIKIAERKRLLCCFQLKRIVCCLFCEKVSRSQECNAVVFCQRKPNKRFNPSKFFWKHKFLRNTFFHRKNSYQLEKGGAGKRARVEKETLIELS